MRICPKCGGQGVITIGMGIEGTTGSMSMQTCDLCKGSGWVEEESYSTVMCPRCGKEIRVKIE